MDHLSQVAKDKYEEFKALLPPMKSRWQQHRANWLPSPKNYFKFNYDGVVFAKVNKSDIGVVIRDNQGLVIASLVQQLSQAYRAVEVKAMAASRALKFGLEFGIHWPILEGDSEVVLKALENEESGSATYELLLKDASLFSSSFSTLSHSHTKRDDNKTTHSLARLAINFSEYTVWLVDVSSQSLNFV